MSETISRNNSNSIPRSELGRTALRIFISPTRSGSTALLRCFENNPAVTRVYHQPIKSGYRQDGVFDYSFFELEQEGTQGILVAKETVGGFKDPETSFSPLPNRGEQEKVGPWVASPEEIKHLEPLILIRDPLQPWGSIERLNRYSEGVSKYHSPFEYFIKSYKVVNDFLSAAKDQDLPVRAITQESLGVHSREVLQAICQMWDIPWTEAMIEWTEPYGSKTWYSDEAKERMRTDPRFKRSKELLERSTRYNYRPSLVDDIEDWQRDVIEEQLLPLYKRAVSYAKQDFPNNT